jgi:hypothetical protein
VVVLAILQLLEPPIQAVAVGEVDIKHLQVLAVQA